MCVWGGGVGGWGVGEDDETIRESADRIKFNSKKTRDRKRDRSKLSL